MLLRRCFDLVRSGLGFEAMYGILGRLVRSLDLVVMLLDVERKMMSMHYCDVDWHFLCI